MSSSFRKIRQSMKPVGWPRYMKCKRLRSKTVSYYWYPNPRDVAAGFTIRCEALGGDYTAAVSRAELLNVHLDAWRSGSTGKPLVKTTSNIGTVRWLFQRYSASPAFEKRVSQRSRYEYRRAMDRIQDVKTLTGVVGDLPVASITEAAADMIYANVQDGPRGKRIRQANLSIDVARRAWEVVRRLAPEVVPVRNPWIGITRDNSKTIKPLATRAEAYALAFQLKEMGEPALGVAALICFEWLQRPENVLGGHLTWRDYRSETRPNEVRIFHHKTKKEVMLPLSDQHGPLFPELERAIEDLPQLGLPMVLTSGTRGPARPYSPVYAQKLVRKARELAGLGKHVTLDACRHGGMTELGDAELTEQGIMNLSGHKTPSAARPYVKHTLLQRGAAARKRRNFVTDC